jgi:adenosylcobinamide-GDP ribazoletransferase
MKHLRLAFSLLTVIKTGHAGIFEPGDLARAAGWFPLVGLAVGALTAAAGWLLARVFPPLPAAALTLAAWASLSGGLHLDGLADCCDALPGSATRDKRLEILRDPRLGSFGGIGLGIFLLLKFSALVSLPIGQGFAAYALPLVLAASLGRWLTLPAALQPLARPGGMAAEMAQGMSFRRLMLAGLIPLALALAGGWRGVAAAAAVCLTAWGIFRVARARLGGVTGDVMGLTVEVSELLVLLAYITVIPG